MPDLSPDVIKAFLGGGGLIGLVTLVVRWWRGRATVRARFVGEQYDLKTEPTVLSSVSIELENIGREPTSVATQVEVTYLSARRERRKSVLSVSEVDRTLQPVTPRVFALTGDMPANYLFSHFREFKLTFSRGPSARVRVLNASGASAGFFRFHSLKLLYRVFGALPHIEA